MQSDNVLKNLQRRLNQLEKNKEKFSQKLNKLEHEYSRMLDWCYNLQYFICSGDADRRKVKNAKQELKEARNECTRYLDEITTLRSSIEKVMKEINDVETELFKPELRIKQIK